MATVTVCDRCGHQLQPGKTKWQVSADLREPHGEVYVQFDFDFCVGCIDDVQKELATTFKKDTR